jgi:hypothetical protein
MRLTEPQLSRFFDRHDALAFVDFACERIAQRRFPRARRAGDKDVSATAHIDREDSGHFCIESELCKRDLPLREAPDRDTRPVGSERREHRMQSRSIGQSRVDHRRCTIQPQPQRTDDALD